MEDLKEACEASLQRGILRADLYKVFLALNFDSFVGDLDAALANRKKNVLHGFTMIYTAQMVLVVRVTSFDDTISHLPSNMQLEATA